MDDKFNIFENWFKAQKNKWSDMGISVKNASYEKKTKTYYQHYRIELFAGNSEGTIILFESNGCYWVDLECVNSDKCEIFCKSVIDFESIDDISDHVKKLEKVMI